MRDLYVCVAVLAAACERDHMIDVVVSNIDCAVADATDSLVTLEHDMRINLLHELIAFTSSPSLFALPYSRPTLLGGMACNTLNRRIASAIASTRKRTVVLAIRLPTRFLGGILCGALPFVACSSCGLDLLTLCGIAPFRKGFAGCGIGVRHLQPHLAATVQGTQRSLAEIHSTY